MHVTTKRRLCWLSALIGACTTQAPVPPAPSPPVHAPPVPTAAQAALTYEGTLSYPLRIALPPDTEALVEVLDSRSEEVVAVLRMALDGRQVPVPFSIDVPAAAPGAARVLRAAFVVNGRRRWRSQTLPLSDAQPRLGTLVLGPIAPSFERYRCGDTLIGFAATEDGRADLELASRRYVLDEVRVAGGLKYVSPIDTGTWFLRAADAVTASVEGTRLPSCTRIGSDAAP